MKQKLERLNYLIANCAFHGALCPITKAVVVGKLVKSADCDCWKKEALVLIQEMGAANG